MPAEKRSVIAYSVSTNTLVVTLSAVPLSTPSVWKWPVFWIHCQPSVTEPTPLRRRERLA